MMNKQMPLQLRTALYSDLELLLYWDRQEHIIKANPNDSWQWEAELGVEKPWREQLIAELAGRPIGFVQIIDPQLEESHYWGEIEANLRAIDIWIGLPQDLSKGYGSEMMRQALIRCFANHQISAVLVDPLADNFRAHKFYRRLGFRFVEIRQFGSDICAVHRLSRSFWNSLVVEKRE